MRASFILAGIGLIQRFHWIFYGLGALLIYSGMRLDSPANTKSIRQEPGREGDARLIPVTDSYQRGRFFVRGWQGIPALCHAVAAGARRNRNH